MIISSIHFDDILHTVLCLTAAILKDSDFNEIDRAECQFTTTATVLDNGTQVWFAYTLVLKFLGFCFLIFRSTCMHPIKGTLLMIMRTSSKKQIWHILCSSKVNVIILIL